MNTIPWYRSHVFTAAVAALLVQLATLADGAFLPELLELKAGAVGRAIAVVLTALVVVLRAVASAQPIALTQGRADEANAVGYIAKQGG